MKSKQYVEAAAAPHHQLHNVKSPGDLKQQLNSTEQALLVCDLLLQSVQALVIADIEGTIIKCNQAFCSLSGYGSKEIVGMSLPRHFSPPHWREFDQQIQLNIQTGLISQRYEREMLRKDGQIIPVEVLVDPHLDHKGNIACITFFITDIGSRKYVQEVLRASEANYRGIFDSANDAIFVMDLQGKPIDANRKVTEILGYTHEEALNISWESLSWDPLPYTPGGNILHVEKALAGEPQLFEWKAKDKFDNALWVEISLEKTYISSQERLLAIIRDVSARRKGIQKLKESEEKYRTIFENTGTATVIIDHDGSILLANAETTVMTGYSKEQLEGRMKWFDLFAEKDVEKLKENHYRRRSHPGEVPRTYDFTIHSRFGGLRSYIITVDVIPGTAMSVASLLDVTRFRQFRKSVWLAEKIIESLAEGIVLTSPQGKILGFNPALTMMTGYEAQEITGNTMEMFIPDEFKDNINALHFGNEGRWQGEFFCRRKDGSMFPVWTSVSPVYDEGKQLAYYVTVVIDNTLQEILRKERHNFKEYQVRAERLASMSMISAGVIHEITQPLNAITLLADGVLFWQEKTNHLNPAEALETFRNINHQVGRINDIIRHVRSFNNINRMHRPQYCDLNVAVEGALDLLAHQMSSHGIKIILNLGHHLPQVLGSYVHLEEVIINLLANAMQALDVSGQEHKKIFCRTFHQDKKLVLEIEDNAGGIDDTIIGHIFEPFFTTKGEGNMGFGLAIVRSILDIYDASVMVSNHDDGGAVFRIEFVASQNPYETGEHL